MSLLDHYKSFLSSTTTSLLAEGATLHYITTLTTVHGSKDVVKHLSSRELKRQDQKIVDAVESPNALALEVETTVEFVSGGGGYLPGLDDNFLSDRVVTFPVVSPIPFR